MNARLFDDVATDSEVEAEKRKREDDPTPRGAVRAVLRETTRSASLEPNPVVALMARAIRSKKPIQALDVCAGFGCWASEFRRLMAAVDIPAQITGIEIDGRKQEHLAKWCDHVVIADWHEPLHESSSWDIAIGNPHFSALTHDDPTQSMPAVLLRHASLVLLFHQEQSFQKSKAGHRLWTEHPPRATYHVSGSIRFRRGINPNTGKPYGADSRCYQATLWQRGFSGPTTSVMLPWLEAEARRWQIPPGTEDRAQAEALGLPFAPSYQETA